jgi:hypothetical protein
MAVFARTSKADPPWLPQVRDFCRSAHIEIVGWGPDLLTVEAKSPERAREIASQFGQLGFKAIASEDNDYAGLLDLSRNPSAVVAKIASFDISRRLLIDRLVPLLWLAVAIALLVPGHGRNAERYPTWLRLLLAAAAIAGFLWEASRVWGWRTQLLPESLRIRRRFRWTTIPWEQIRAVDSIAAKATRNQEQVVLKLTTGSSERLGTFNIAFARNLRDRLRYEITQRTGR